MYVIENFDINRTLLNCKLENFANKVLPKKGHWSGEYGDEYGDEYGNEDEFEVCYNESTNEHILLCKKKSLSELNSTHLQCSIINFKYVPYNSVVNDLIYSLDC